MSTQTRETVYCAAVWLACLLFCGLSWYNVALYVARHV